MFELSLTDLLTSDSKLMKCFRFSRTPIWSASISSDCFEWCDWSNCSAKGKVSKRCFGLSSSPFKSVLPCYVTLVFLLHKSMTSSCSGTALRGLADRDVVLHLRRDRNADVRQDSQGRRDRFEHKQQLPVFPGRHLSSVQIGHGGGLARDHVVLCQLPRRPVRPSIWQLQEVHQREGCRVQRTGAGLWQQLCISLFHYFLRRVLLFGWFPSSNFLQKHWWTFNTSPFLDHQFIRGCYHGQFRLSHSWLVYFGTASSGRIHSSLVRIWSRSQVSQSAFVCQKTPVVFLHWFLYCLSEVA